jgi:hypothetical protein
MPPSEGIPLSTSLLASNTSGGASRAWLEPWPCMGASLVVPDSATRGQLSNPSRGPAFDPSRFISGSEPVTHVSGNIHPWILLLPVLGASFQEGKRDQRGSGWRGAMVTECMADMCPYLRFLRGRLGKVIECKNCSYLFTRSLAFRRGIRARPEVLFTPTGPLCFRLPCLLHLLCLLCALQPPSSAAVVPSPTAHCFSDKNGGQEPDPPCGRLGLFLGDREEARRVGPRWASAAKGESDPAEIEGAAV